MSLIEIKKISSDIRNNLLSAKSAFDDAEVLPKDSQHNATRIFLYLIAWETAHKAQRKWYLMDPERAEFLYSQKGTTENEYRKKLDTKHDAKFEFAPPIYYEGKDKNISKVWHDPKDLEKLRQWTQYGSAGMNREELFRSGWKFDGFYQTLKGKITILGSLFDFNDQKVGSISWPD